MTTVFLIFALVSAVIVGGTNIAVRFQHPDLTETQLLIRLWQFDLLGVAVTILNLWMANREAHRR